MPDSVPADIDLYFHASLIVLRPNNDGARRWIQANLKPAGWQVGPAGTYLAAKTEFESLTSWLRRSGITYEVKNPHQAR